MLNKNAVLLTFALLIPTAGMHAYKPKTNMEKVGHSIVQTINKHPFITSFAVATGLSCLLKNDGPFLVIWAGGGVLLETATDILMNNFDIDQIKK